MTRHIPPFKITLPDLLTWGSEGHDGDKLRTAHNLNQVTTMSHLPLAAVMVACLLLFGLLLAAEKS
ncbi:MAG: hypothetical protein ACUVTW_09055 [Thermogutta sp.]